MWFDFGEKYKNALQVSSSPSFYWAAEGSGPNAVPPSVWANEWPSTPAQDAGLPATTGPNLLLYAIGLGKEPHIVSASITTDNGQAADARIVDAGVGSALRWSGVLVMSQPARPFTRYHVSVQWHNEDPNGSPACDLEPSYPGQYDEECAEQTQIFTQQFSFTTGAEALDEDEGAARNPHLKFAFVHVKGQRVRVGLHLANGASSQGRLQLTARSWPGKRQRKLTLNDQLQAQLKIGRKKVWLLRAEFTPRANSGWRKAGVSRLVRDGKKGTRTKRRRETQAGFLFRALGWLSEPRISEEGELGDVFAPFLASRRSVLIIRTGSDG